MRPAPPGGPAPGGPDEPFPAPGAKGPAGLPAQLGWWAADPPLPPDDGRQILLDLDVPEDLGPDPRRRASRSRRDARRRPPARTRSERRTRIALGTAVALLLGAAAAGTVALTRGGSPGCNTAFIGLAKELPDGALADAAALYGFGMDQLLPIAAVSGEVPEPRSPQEAAADAIGQGRVGAGPLVMATVAAAVADGT